MRLERKKAFSMKPVPVSAYDGSLKNLKVLKDVPLYVERSLCRMPTLFTSKHSWPKRFASQAPGGRCTDSEHSGSCTPRRVREPYTLNTGL